MSDGAAEGRREVAVCEEVEEEEEGRSGRGADGRRPRPGSASSSASSALSAPLPVVRVLPLLPLLALTTLPLRLTPVLPTPCKSALLLLFIVAVLPFLPAKNSLLFWPLTPRGVPGVTVVWLETDPRGFGLVGTARTKEAEVAVVREEIRTGEEGGRALPPIEWNEEGREEGP